MQHDEFVGQVQNRAKLPSRGDAEGATRARLGGESGFPAAAGDR
jgi:uncharacterized protein (DUF2267 family)